FWASAGVLAGSSFLGGGGGSKAIGFESFAASAMRLLACRLVPFGPMTSTTYVRSTSEMFFTKMKNGCFVLGRTSRSGTMSAGLLSSSFFAMMTSASSARATVASDRSPAHTKYGRRKAVIGNPQLSRPPGVQPADDFVQVGRQCLRGPG